MQHGAAGGTTSARLAGVVTETVAYISGKTRVRDLGVQRSAPSHPRDRIEGGDKPLHTLRRSSVGIGFLSRPGAPTQARAPCPPRRHRRRTQTGSMSRRGNSSGVVPPESSPDSVPGFALSGDHLGLPRARGGGTAALTPSSPPPEASRAAAAHGSSAARARPSLCAWSISRWRRRGPHPPLRAFSRRRAAERLCALPTPRGRRPVGATRSPPAGSPLRPCCPGAQVWLDPLGDGREDVRTPYRRRRPPRLSKRGRHLLLADHSCASAAASSCLLESHTSPRVTRDSVLDRAQRAA